MADDYNSRAAVGQAMNLAVMTAIAEGKTKDTRFIYSEFIRYMELGNLLQNTSLEDLKKALK